MISTNHVILAGNIAFNPELRQTKNGSNVCSLRLATTRRWKDKGGEQKEETLFIDVVLWGNTAAWAAERLRKGSNILVEGRLQSREWEKDGVKRSTIEVVADRVQSTESRPKGEPREAPEVGNDEIPF